MSKNKKKFKVHKSTKRMLAELIKDLPNIPFFVPNPKDPNGQPIAKEIVKYVDKKGSEILLSTPDATINGNPLDPDTVYRQPMKAMVFQDHNASITAAYRKYGEEGATEYCKQVWDFYLEIKSLPPEPKELVLEATPESNEEPQSLKLPE